MHARVYHLALASDWSRAPDRDYASSTLGKSLEEVGFIHLAFAPQLRQVADRFYKRRADVVLLEIEIARLRAALAVEAIETGERFPHLYGPLNRDAVVRAVPLPLRDDGRLELQALGGPAPRR